MSWFIFNSLKIDFLTGLDIEHHDFQYLTRLSLAHSVALNVTMPKSSVPFYDVLRNAFIHTRIQR